nr:MAG TPA: Thioredoxin-like domain [Bacteriophage sp.]DAV71220.1 MAG TPA: Thioredoxin-like domain [Bacteriophage sp.]
MKIRRFLRKNICNVTLICDPFCPPLVSPL